MRVYTSKYPVPKPGDKFNKWTVLDEGQRINGRMHYQCVCECGNKGLIEKYNLVKGKSKGCGCCNHNTMPLTPMPHGIHKTRIYRIFKGMMDRCYLKSCWQYERYGGSGIAVCDEWKNDSMAFYNWAVTHGYQDGLTIDRIDGAKGYSPDNCRWVTPAEQQHNIKSNVNLTLNGKTQCAGVWAKELGIPKSTLFNRLRRGMSDEEALTTPIMKVKSSRYNYGKEATNNG